MFRKLASYATLVIVTLASAMPNIAAAATGDCKPVEVLIGTSDIVGAVCNDSQNQPSSSDSSPANAWATEQSSEVFVDMLDIAIDAESANSSCEWYALDEPPDSPLWGGNSPSSGHLSALRCGDIADDGSGGGGALLDYQFVANDDGQPNALPPPPPPSPYELAQRAASQIVVPVPAIGAGPDRTKLAVNLWTWLWIDNPGPLTATAAAGGVSVTATATLESVTWSLGEPAATGGTYAPGPPVTITCQGTGTAPPPDYDWKAEPPCGHKYTWMSTTDRTGGTGKWPITATTNWTVTWQSNTGVSGATALTATGTDALEIGEYRVVLVQGAGG